MSAARLARAGLHGGRRRPIRGLTLLEMLVTLVLFGMISTLLWQALAQVARIETQLADQRVLGETEALQRAWVQQALAGVATGSPGEPLRFTGTASTLESWTTQPPWPQAGGLERMALQLVTRREGNREISAVQVRRVPFGPASAPDRAPGAVDDPAATLWQWEGPGRLEYLDAEQRWRSRWPPAGAAADDPRTVLPRAIRLQGPPSGPLWVAVLATQNPIARRADLPLADDDPR